MEVRRMWGKDNGYIHLAVYFGESVLSSWSSTHPGSIRASCQSENKLASLLAFDFSIIFGELESVCLTIGGAVGLAHEGFLSPDLAALPLTYFSC